MFDISFYADDFFARNDETQEPPFRAIINWLPPSQEALITRYERRLGRLLTCDEGQILIHARFAPDPQKALPRFMRCVTCGAWLDQGKLQARPYQRRSLCDDCEIPF